MKRFLLIVWQLPQTLLGLLMLAFVEPEASMIVEGKIVLFSTKTKGGISLGEIILFGSKFQEDQWVNIRKHEVGHSMQSEILGWFYLLVIGLPSLLHAIFYHGDYKGYYSFYTERWADKLGGVER